MIKLSCFKRLYINHRIKLIQNEINEIDTDMINVRCTTMLCGNIERYRKGIDHKITDAMAKVNMVLDDKYIREEHVKDVDNKLHMFIEWLDKYYGCDYSLKIEFEKARYKIQTLLNK